jgi:hypothetical protein
MPFPDRHPELALYRRLGTVIILLGAFWSVVGALAGSNAGPQTGEAGLAPWQLAWWEQFGWGYGAALIVLGASILVFRAVRKRSHLFGDRIRREYK